MGPVSPSKLSSIMKNPSKIPNIIKPMRVLEQNTSLNEGSQNYIGAQSYQLNNSNGTRKLVKLMAKPSGGPRVGGSAPSLSITRSSSGIAPPPPGGMANIAKVATRFKCLQCPKSYVNKNAMERHFHDVHKGVTVAPSNGARNRAASLRSNNVPNNKPTVVQKTLYKKVTKGIVLGEVDLTEDEPEENTSKKPTVATQPEPVSKETETEVTDKFTEADFESILPD